MSQNRTAEWRERYGNLLDADLDRFEVAETVEEAPDRAAMRKQLRELFDRHPGVDRILIIIDKERAGVAARTQADRDAGSAGDGESSLNLGASDGATLPGLSGQFRLITFACPRSGCPEKVLRSFYDNRRIPACSRHEVPMEMNA